MFPDSEFAPAKINLYLHVTGRREDGYHLLDSLVTFAQTGDRLTVTPSKDLSLSVTGPFGAELADLPDNLVLRAAQALGERAGVRPNGHLLLEKNLPVASGIGGGSADAAAALKLMMRHWRIVPDLADIHAVALGLGADLPVCLTGHTTIMSGIGEILRPAPKLPACGLVLVNPRIPLATAAVFKALGGRFSEPAAAPHGPWPDVWAMVTDLQQTGNDLEAPARQLVPVIGDVLASISAFPGCLIARVSGSGATCFGLFESARVAERAAAGITREGWWVWGGSIWDESAF